MAETNSSIPISALASQICTQIASVFTNPTSKPPPLDLMVDELAAAAARGGRIFVYGVGREGLMLKALCMRLFHLGLDAHCVFDMTTPPISAADLLIASAGPGGFSTVDAICGVAKSNGACVMLITGHLGSSAQYGTVIVEIPAQTMADDDGDGDVDGLGGSRALLPMGSLYEGAMFVLFEIVVFRLGEVLGQSAAAVRSRHTNLE